ncbi:TPA: hypothetical protein ACXNQ3_001381 [Serratia marcescens]
MNRDELINFCHEVRHALEMANGKGIHDESTSIGMSNFPTGCCGDTTNLLACLIYQKFGEIALHRSGTYMAHIKPDSRLSDNKSHAWLELSGTIIDLTADQFNYLGFSNATVMVTTDLSFHDLFSYRDPRSNPKSPTPPSLNQELTKSLCYVQEKLRLPRLSL